MAEATEEIQVQENAQPERPDWLPSNFATGEDLVKSYSHSTQKITEQGQELAALRGQIEEIQAAQTSQQSQTYGNDLEAQLIDAFESGDGRTAAAAAAFLAQQAVEAYAKQHQPAPQNTSELTAHYAESVVASEYSDWADLRAKVGEVIGATPYLRDAIAGETSPNKVADHLRAAYKLAKYESGQTAATNAAETLAELARTTKQSAQTMSGTNSSTEAESYWDSVKAAKSGIPSFG